MSTVIYEFTVRNASPAEPWNTTPEKMVDGSQTSYAETNSTGDEEELITNECDGTDLGTISNVHIRYYGYGDVDDRIDLTPWFDGVEGSEYETTPGINPIWIDWVEITNDGNAPDWSSWTHIQTLDVYVEFHKASKGNTMHCGMVQVQVTYTGGVSTSSSKSCFVRGGEQASDSNPCFVAGGVDVLDSQACFVAGGVNVSSSKSAYLKGKDTSSSSKSCYLKGEDTGSSSKSCYTKGKDTGSSSKVCYTTGQVGLKKTLGGGYIFDDFADGDYTADPPWTVDAGTWEVNVSNQLRSTGGATSQIRVDLIKTCPNAFLVKGKIYFEHGDSSGNYALITVTNGSNLGYGILINKHYPATAGVLRIIKSTGYWAWADLATRANDGALQNEWDTFVFSRNSSGEMHFWFTNSNGTYHLTVIDVTYSDFTRLNVLDRFYAAGHNKRFDDLEVLEYPGAETITVKGLSEGYRIKLFDGGDVLRGDAYTNVYPFTQFGRTDHTAVHSMNVPHAYYHNGKTYFAWMDSENAPWIIYYTHSTDTWSEPVRVGDPVPNSDDHSSPAIIVDDSGYIYVCSVEHLADVGDAWIWRSTNTEDITAWEAKVSVADYATYPHFVKVTLNSTEYIYLFFRGRDGGTQADSHYRLSWVRTSDHGASWSAPSVFVDFTSGSNWAYPRRVHVDSGNNIHIVFEQRTGAGGDYHDILYAKSPNGGTTWEEADGTGYSLPITYAAAEKVRVGTNLGGQGLGTDESNVQYIMGAAAGEAFIKIYRWNGSSWDTYEAIPGTGTIGGALQVVSSTDLRAYVTTDNYASLEYWQSKDEAANWSKQRVIADIDSNARITRIQEHFGCVWNDSYQGVYAYISREWKTKARLLQEVTTLAFPFTGYFVIYDADGNELGEAPPSGAWDDIWAGDEYTLTGENPASSDKPAYLKGQDTALDSNPCYIAGGGIDVTDSAPAYIKGKDTSFSSKACYVAGGINVTTSKPAYVKGKDIALSNKSAYINGGVNVSDSTPCYLKGQDTSSSSKPCYIAGGINVSDFQGCFISGVLGASDFQPAYIKGKDTASDSQPAYIKGKDVASDNKSCYVAGGIDVTDLAASYIKGKDTAVDNKAAYISGGIDALDSQSAYIKGKDTSSSSVEAYITGGINVVDSNSAFISGIAGAKDSQSAYIRGKDTASSSKSAYLKGKDTLSDSTPAYIAGGINVISSKPSYLKGQDTADDSKSAYINGGINVVDFTPAYIKGQSTALSFKPCYIVGSINITSSKPCYIKGQDSLVDSQSCYIRGKLSTLDSQSCFIRGGVVSIDSKSCYVKGKEEISASKSCFVAGEIQTSDSQSCYIKGQGIAIDSKPCYICGIVTEASDSVPCYIKGGISLLSSQPAYIKGWATSSDSQSCYVIGGIQVSDSQNCFISGIIYEVPCITRVRTHPEPVNVISAKTRKGDIVDTKEVKPNIINITECDVQI